MKGLEIMKQLARDFKSYYKRETWVKEKIQISYPIRDTVQDKMDDRKIFYSSYANSNVRSWNNILHTCFKDKY